MIPISPNRETFTTVPSAAAGIKMQRMIPTNSPGGTLVGFEVSNGVTPATNATTGTFTVSKALAATPTVFTVLATVTWSSTQAAWTGVHADVYGTTPGAVTAAGNLAKSNMGCSFAPGDVIKVASTTLATAATTGFFTLLWE